MRNQFVLYFEANVPPMGAMAYFIEPHLERSFESVSVSFNRPIEAPSWLTAAMPGIVVSYASTSVTITNGDLLVRFSDSDGSIESFQSSAEPTPRKLQQAYFEYPSDNAWDNHYTFKSSGPATKIDRFAGSRYGVDCFHTQHQTSTQVSEIADLPIDSRAMDRYTLCVRVFRCVRGSLVSECYRVITPQIQQLVRVYKGSNQIEVVDHVAPKSATDVVTRYETDIDSQKRFVTDDNGLELVQRQFIDNDPKILISGNYYPTVYVSGLQSEKDAGKQFLVVSDRPHGVTSSRSGEFEVMLHRNAKQVHGTRECIQVSSRSLIHSRANTLAFQSINRSIDQTNQQATARS